VLIAEDQAGLRAVLCLSLAGAGFRAWPAADGAEALEVFREHGAEIDAVLLDHRMPNKDGAEAMAELRALAPRLPCCMMTGAGPDVAAELAAVGATRVLTKPFDLADMIMLMQTLCPRAGRTTAPGLRVLAADAQPGGAEALGRLLAQWGHEARVAQVGPEALAAAAEFGPDVVLLDLALPGLEPFEVARRLHELPGLRGVVFVALASQSDDEYRRLLQEAGFAFQVVRSPDLAELEGVLKALAQRKAAGPPG
jgi:CheY-like chemotaxis protein